MKDKLSSDYKMKKKKAIEKARYLTKLMLEGKYEEMEDAANKMSKELQEKKEPPNHQRSKAPEDMYRKDFCNADQFPYRNSPSFNGNRPKNELLGGTGSNMYRKWR